MKTIKLQRPTLDIPPAVPAVIMAATIALLFVVNIAATWPAPQARPVVVPTPALPIIVIATRAPEARQQLVIERVIQVVVTATPPAQPAPAEAQPQAAPEPVYVVQSAPEAQPTAAPTPWVGDPQIRHNENGSTESVITVPTDAPRLCTGFHDWRDYDAMYASSPVCGQP